MHLHHYSACCSEEKNIARVALRYSVIEALHGSIAALQLSGNSSIARIGDINYLFLTIASVVMDSFEFSLLLPETAEILLHPPQLSLITRSFGTNNLLIMMTKRLCFAKV